MCSLVERLPEVAQDRRSAAWVLDHPPVTEPVKGRDAGSGAVAGSALHGHVAYEVVVGGVDVQARTLCRGYEAFAELCHAGLRRRPVEGEDAAPHRVVERLGHPG